MSPGRASWCPSHVRRRGFAKVLFDTDIQHIFHPRSSDPGGVRQRFVPVSTDEKPQISKRFRRRRPRTRLGQREDCRRAHLSCDIQRGKTGHLGMIDMGDDTLSSVPRWVPTHVAPGKTEEQERVRLAIGWELLAMIDEGLLEWSIDPLTSEAVFWATPKGVILLGMLN